MKKQISMIMADLSWGHINIFRRNTRGLCFSWYTRGLCSQGMQRTIKKGIVFIQLQGNDILVNCKEINSFKGHIFIHKKYNHSRQLYSFTESYSFQRTYQFILGNISSFKENIFIQGHYIPSRIYINLSYIYLFKFKAICSFADIAEIFIQKLCPAPLFS